MNEHFLKILMTVGFENIRYDPEYGQVLENFTMRDAEKFAELIVLECVRYFNEDYQRNFDTLWREDLTKNIKEHFGVEE